MLTKTIRTESRWNEGQRAEVCAPGKPILELALPPEMNGPEHVWDPEELFVASVETCVMLTCYSLFRKRNLVWSRYKSHATGMLEKGPDGIVFRHIDVYVVLEVPEEPEAATELLKEALDYCPVSRSVKCSVEVHPEVIRCATVTG